MKCRGCCSSQRRRRRRRRRRSRSRLRGARGGRGGDATTERSPTTQAQVGTTTTTLFGVSAADTDDSDDGIDGDGMMKTTMTGGRRHDPANNSTTRYSRDVKHLNYFFLRVSFLLHEVPFYFYWFYGGCGCACVCDTCVKVGGEAKTTRCVLVRRSVEGCRGLSRLTHGARAGNKLLARDEREQGRCPFGHELFQRFCFCSHRGFLVNEHNCIFIEILHTFDERGAPHATDVAPLTTAS